VKAWRTRTGEELEGVVIEVVPPQRFPLRFPSAARGVDFQARYVIQTAKARPIIRALDQLEVVAL